MYIHTYRENTKVKMNTSSKKRFIYEQKNAKKKLYLVVSKNWKNWAVVVHAFIPSAWKVEAGGSLTSGPAWPTE